MLRILVVVPGEWEEFVEEESLWESEEPIRVSEEVEKGDVGEYCTL